MDYGADIEFLARGSRHQLNALRRKVRSRIPDVNFELREVSPRARAAFAQQELFDLVISGLASGVARSMIDWLVTALKQARSEGKLTWRRRKGGAPKSRAPRKAAAKPRSQKPGSRTKPADEGAR
jgi:hypothetical protein